MRAISGKEFARILERNGWVLVRVKGSHNIYCKPGNTVRLSVPIHGNQTLKVGLLHKLMKTAGLREEDV